MSDQPRPQGSPLALPPGERCFRALVENGLDVFALLCAEGTILYASPSIARLLGHPPEAVLGQSALALVHPDDLPAKQALLARALAAPGAHFTQVLRLRHRQGDWRRVEVQETNLLHDDAVGAIVA